MANVARLERQVHRAHRAMAGLEADAAAAGMTAGRLAELEAELGVASARRQARATPPGPAMAPAPASSAGRIRAGAYEISPTDPVATGKLTQAQGEPGARRGGSGGAARIWARPSNAARSDGKEKPIVAADRHCLTCEAPLRLRADGGWACWGCAMSAHPLRLRIAVIAAWGEGIPVSAIGERVGLTASAVVGLVRRMGLPGRPSPIKRDGSPKPPPAPKLPGGERRAQRTVFYLKKRSKPLPAFPVERPVCEAAALPPEAPLALPGGSAGAAENVAAEPMATVRRHRGGYTECQYPTGKRLFCEQPTQIGYPYCPVHVRRCFTSVSK